MSLILLSLSPLDGFMVISGVGDETVYDLRLVMVPEAGLNDNKKTKDNKTSSWNHKMSCLFNLFRYRWFIRYVRESVTCVCYFLSLDRLSRFAHPLDSAPRLIMVELGLSLNVLSFKPA